MGRPLCAPLLVWHRLAIFLAAILPVQNHIFVLITWASTWKHSPKPEYKINNFWKSLYPTTRSHSKSRRLWKISCPCREWNHDFFVVQPAAWSLRRLSYPGFRECYDLNNYGSLAVGIYVSPSGTISVQSPRRGSTAACLLELRFRIPPGQGYVSLVNVVYCKVEFLSQADPSSRGVLRSVCVCVCVWARARPLVWLNETISLYSQAPHNDVSVNDGSHIRRWSHKIYFNIIL